FIDQNKIEGKVIVDDSLKDKCKGTLFLIVRKGVSPQPLAVKKIKFNDKEYKFKLTPADVIIEDLYKEFTGELIVYAKVSKSGNPMESSNSCESEPIVVKSGSKNVVIKINRYLE
ncbi:c-type cytochrome biogenesis protein CcmI/CycH, partial [Sulfurihydrogenibium yellowstonense]